MLAQLEAEHYRAVYGAAGDGDDHGDGDDDLGDAANEGAADDDAAADEGDHDEGDPDEGADEGDPATDDHDDRDHDDIDIDIDIDPDDAEPVTDLQRLGLSHLPLPRDACGATFYDQGDDFARFARVFHWLSDEPGLGLLVGDPGVGKTATIRHLCAQLSRPRHRVLYLCDSTLSPTGIYRTLAGELGLRPHHRRGQLWTDLKRALQHLSSPPSSTTTSTAATC